MKGNICRHKYNYDHEVNILFLIVIKLQPIYEGEEGKSDILPGQLSDSNTRKLVDVCF